MARLNLTLDPDVERRIARRAKAERVPRAALARSLINEALARREALDERRKLARDYAAGRADARAILHGHEVAQFELLDDEDA